MELLIHHHSCKSPMRRLQQKTHRTAKILAKVVNKVEQDQNKTYQHQLPSYQATKLPSSKLLKFFLCDLQGAYLRDGFNGGRARLVAQQGVLAEVVALLQRGHLLPEINDHHGSRDEPKYKQLVIFILVNIWLILINLLYHEPKQTIN